MELKKQYYDNNGYVVIKNFIPCDLIDNVISVYLKDIFLSKKKFFRQSTGKYEINKFNPSGYVTQSFLDVHNFSSFPQFRKCVMDIILNDTVMETINFISGSKANRLMQSMLFDANTATCSHQDWFYLDSVPNGNLFGGWFALEDIEENAGRFYVMPRSQHEVFHDKNLTISQNNWLKKIVEYTQQNKDKLVAPALQKGDVLIWNSRLIHGAFETTDFKFSRRSLTAHYLPKEYQFGNLHTTKDWISYKKYGDYEYYANQPEYSKRAHLESKARELLYNSPFLLKFIRKFQNRSISQ